MSTREWKTRDGTNIRIKGMSDSHLINSIALMERRAAKKVFGMPYPRSNGDMAQMYAEAEWLSLMLHSEQLLSGSIYDGLIEEAERRKLHLETKNQYED